MFVISTFNSGKQTKSISFKRINLLIFGCFCVKLLMSLRINCNNFIRAGLQGLRSRSLSYANTDRLLLACRSGRERVTWSCDSRRSQVDKVRQIVLNESVDVNWTPGGLRGINRTCVVGRVVDCGWLLSPSLSLIKLGN